ncbi:MAG: methylated-DNA--[protein]-cysteine S-methyltransferase, partial [Vicinamibacterales bacterium]
MDDSPAGSLVLAGNRDGLHVLAFTSGMRPFTIDPTWRPDHENMLGGVRKQLDDYFAGRLRAFKTRLAFEGTPFQRQVWNELCRIPYGETISYLELARRIGNPKAVRAVGLANGANPIAIIVPCHRVIGADGSLTGYGGGLPIKKAL